jgi:penicillin-binding protein 2
VSLNLKLTEEQVSLFSVNRHLFPEVTLNADLSRDYPHAGLLAHILGYVSEINKDDATTLDKKRYAGTSHIGKIGLEKQYEHQLHGSPGYQKIETDVLGREVRVMSISPATAGQDLHLTLDMDLQEAATGFLTGRRGAIVALDPRNGEILAFVSAPSFDPNAFVQGLDAKTYQSLIQAPERPLYNRVIQGQYPPASTVKPLVALSALAAKRISPKDKIFDPGWYQLGGRGRQYRDWVKKGHGVTDMEKSIRESCDVYYYMLAEKLGISHLASWFSQIGFGKSTGIDIPGEQKGVVPSNAWKRKVYGQPWFPGETLSVGIGQGYSLITPLQLAVMGSYFANRGHAFKPHFNKDLKPEKLPALKIDDPNIWPHVIEPMRQVIQHPRGTAYRFFKDLPFDVAGKSGTAQVFNLKQDEKYEHYSVAKHLRDHSLFYAFAPVDSPKIVVAIVLENEKASAEVARQMIEAYLSDKSNAEQNNLFPTL